MNSIQEKKLFTLFNLWNHSVSEGTSNLFGPDAPFIFFEIGRVAVAKLQGEGINFFKDTPLETINAVYSFFTRHGYFEEAWARPLTPEESALFKRKEKALLLYEKSSIAYDLNGWDPSVKGRSPSYFCFNILRYCLISRFGLDFSLLNAERPKQSREDFIQMALVPVRGETLKGMSLLEELRKDEAGLQKVSARYQRVIEMSLDAIVVADESGIITLWNTAAERMFGYSTPEALGLPVDRIVPEKLIERHRNGMNRFLATEAPVVIGKTVEMEGRRKDGALFPIELSLSSEKSDSGWIFSAVIRDISDRKRVEKVLELNQKSLQRAQEIAHLGNWDWNMRDNACHWSDEIYRLFDLPSRDFPASMDAFLAFVHPEDRSSVEKALDQSLIQGKPFSFEHRIIRTDGMEMAVYEQGEAVKDPSGRVISITGTIQDITERKRMEEIINRIRSEKEKLEAVKTLSITYAHHIRNAVTPIRGFAEMIQKRLEPSDPKYQWAELVMENSERVVELLSKLEEIDAYSTVNFGGVDILDIDRLKK